MSYIRFTANSLTEDLRMLLLQWLTLCETVVFEDDDSDCTYYETELGQSLEFAPAEDLDERVVEAICDTLGAHLEDFTVEATGQ